MAAGINDDYKGFGVIGSYEDMPEHKKPVHMQGAANREIYFGDEDDNAGFGYFERMEEERKASTNQVRLALHTVIDHKETQEQQEQDEKASLTEK